MRKAEIYINSEFKGKISFENDSLKIIDCENDYQVSDVEKGMWFNIINHNFNGTCSFKLGNDRYLFAKYGEVTC